MGALKWDDELAYLAELNAMSCEIEHDKVIETHLYVYYAYLIYCCLS